MLACPPQHDSLLINGRHHGIVDVGVESDALHKHFEVAGEQIGSLKIFDE